jgi:cytochrome c-type biogenesis protein CcmH/NrfG
VWNLGRLAEAEMALRDALRLQPDYADALGYLVRVLMEYSRHYSGRSVVRRAATARKSGPV